MRLYKKNYRIFLYIGIIIIGFFLIKNLIYNRNYTEPFYDRHKFKILIYTHSEYSFLWKATIPMLEKYAKFDIIWCCDKLLDYKIPDSWIVYKYDESLSWSSRIKACMDKTMQNTDYILYLQEDWLPIDTIQKERINYSMELMASRSIDFLSSSMQDKIPVKEDIFDTKYPEYQFKLVKGFWLQPAIWKKSVLYEFVQYDRKLPGIEQGNTEVLMNSKKCAHIFHKDYLKHSTIRCFYYPHVHAITQGKWNFLKYPYLKEIIESYGIDTTTRTVNNVWLLHEE